MGGRSGYVLPIDPANGSAWMRYMKNAAIEIKNDAGKVCFKVLPHGMTVKALESALNFPEQNAQGPDVGSAHPCMKMHLTLPSGEKAAVLQHRLLRKEYDSSKTGEKWTRWVDEKWMLFAYSPCFDGQQSSESDRDGAPLYAYAKITKTRVTLVTADGSESAVSGLAPLVECITSNYMSVQYRRTLPHDAGQPAKSDQAEEYDLSVIATGASRPYLMSKSGGASDGTYFAWSRETELGVDVAAGVDALLVIAHLAVCSAPLGSIQHGANGVFLPGGGAGQFGG